MFHHADVAFRRALQRCYSITFYLRLAVFLPKTAVMKENIKKSLIWAVILSETSHVFCCVLPTLFSLMGLLAGFGLVVALPGFMVEIHERLHGYEVPMIVFSALILAFGWAVTLYSDKIDCHNSGCAHGDCHPRKNNAHFVLKIATLLFVANLTVYLVVHRSHWFADTVGSALIEAGHNHSQH